MRALEPAIERDAPIPTWFGVGGRAERLAMIEREDDLRRCVEIDPDLRVLGEGANLLVADEGVGELVVSMMTVPMRRFEIDDETIVAMGGASLATLVTSSVREGLAGLEGLGGIPATIGGAVMMNAGGTFGQIADVVERVHAIDRTGAEVALDRGDIDFGYRHSGLGGLIVSRVELRLRRGDSTALRGRLKETMAYKKTSQPMADKSAGCVFKNPTLSRDVDGIGGAGERVSAGMVIDRAGCKGLGVGGASVSELHANFVVSRRGSTATDALTLIDMVEARVLERFGIALERELVVWRRQS
jgi:UDP-N-acetylmuramate dehydrogenase